MRSIRWRLHAQRPKHERRMAYAEAKVEAALALKRTALQNPNEAVKYAMLGFGELRRAIAAVVDCGCPESMWRESVRENVMGGK